MWYVAVEFPVFKINVGGQMEARQFDDFRINMTACDTVWLFYHIFQDQSKGK